MAVRKPSRRDKPWRFYVYAITEGKQLLYVGKGCGRRLQAQCRNHAADGHEVARFWLEQDAFDFERDYIEEHSPPRNKSPGGGGSRADPLDVWPPCRPSALEVAMYRHCRIFGTKDAARRGLISLGLWNKESQLEYERRASAGFA